MERIKQYVPEQVGFSPPILNVYFMFSELENSLCISVPSFNSYYFLLDGQF